MNKRFLLLGLIFALSALVSHAQIYEMFSQDFETGTPVNYTSSSSAATVQTTIVSGGSRALKILHTQGVQTTVLFDTIDLSSISNLNYYKFEFMHIALVNPRAQPDGTQGDVCVIEAKLTNQTDWTRLNSTHYETEEPSTDFPSTANFHKYSYPMWEFATVPTNS